MPSNKVLLNNIGGDSNGRGLQHTQNLRDLRIAMHSKKFDSASQILDICQAAAYADGSTNELVRPIAHSAAKQMLYHLQAMYQLKLDSIEAAAFHQQCFTEKKVGK